jgi:ABC-type transport system involved in Fe-S cluster assembly fused permease/ATPase subunit
MLSTFAVYTIFTNKYSNTRVKFIQNKMSIDKMQEFFLNESIMNYETVK